MPENLTLCAFDEKIKLAKALFSDFKGEFECFSSPLKCYRTRAEFSFFRDEQGLHYAMFDAKSKRKFIVKRFEIAVLPIQNAMSALLDELNLRPTLAFKLFGAEFLATKDDLSITLLYHTDINALKNELCALQKRLKFHLIARSKGKKLVFGDENLLQRLNINEQEFLYEFNNDCFVQPNTAINEKMIKWVFDKIATQERADLCELYCGYGNFTLPLSRLFRRVLATEISKTNIHFARLNAAANKTHNTSFVRLSSSELAEALSGVREFYRLKELDINLSEFDFSHIFIDPPRAGLDDGVREFVAEFGHIIYISCNPQSLKRDLSALLKTHEILHFALFDQFATTAHLECGVILGKI